MNGKGDSVGEMLALDGCWREGWGGSVVAVVGGTWMGVAPSGGSTGGVQEGKN
jgi:hypothetical protein